MEINENILSMCKDEGVYFRGEQIYKNGYLKINQITNQNSPDNINKTIMASVIASDGVNSYSTFIQINSNQILKSGCECPYFEVNSSYTLCKHLVATILGYFEQINKAKQNKKVVQLTNSLLTNNRKSENLELIQHFKKLIPKNVQKNKIEFYYALTRECVQIELKVLNKENSRFYKIRNLAKFIESYINKELFILTPNFKIDFANSDFEMYKYESFVLNLLQSIYKAEYRKYKFNDQTFVNECLNINYEDFYHILEQYKGNNIIIDMNSKNKYWSYSSVKDYSYSYFVSDQKYNFDIELSYSKDKINVKFNDSINFIQENEFPIIYKDNIIFLLEENIDKTFIPLYKYASYNIDNTISFDKNTIPDFINYIFPKIKLLNDNISLPNEIQNKVLEAKMEASLYLDYINENIIGILKYKYGEYTIDNFNIITPLIDENKILNRNFASEAEIIQILYDAGFKNINNEFHFKSDDKGYFDFLTEKLFELKKHFTIFYSNNFEKISQVKEPKIKISIEPSDNNFLDFNFEMTDISPDEMREILSKSYSKEKYYRLKTGTLISINGLEIENISKVLNSFDIDLNKNFNKISKIDAVFLSNLLNNFNPTWKEKEKYLNIFNNISNSPISYTLPKTLNAQLREYQIFGFQWLKTLSNEKLSGILADEMGLGKTLQTIAFILSEIEENKKIDPILIVCPPSLIYNWESEIKKFAPSLKSLLLVGNPSQRRDLLKEINNYDIVITSYAILKKESDNLIKTKFAYSFIDEAQYIKNWHSDVSKCIKTINAPIRFALTGTPIENSLEELWSIFDYCLPGYLLSNRKFQEVFNRPIYRDNDFEKLQLLKSKIRPFILRRLKADVIKELPDKIVHNILVEMTDEQKKLYATFAKTAKAELNDEFMKFGIEKSTIKILAVLTRLRQICCDPSVFIENYKGRSGKFEILQNILEENKTENKILIFSQFTSVLKNLHKEFETSKNAILYMDGKTKVDKRKDIIEKFMNDEQYRIFMLSLKTGGVGLNLTKANIVVHFDPWWNPAVENQATDRAHRIGQKNIVEVIKLITKGTIEEKILKLHEKKLKLSKDLIDEDQVEVLLTSLSQSDINQLLDYEF